MQNATATQPSIEATQGALIPTYQPLTQRRRSDPAQWAIERGNAFPPLELVTKPNLTTAELAHYSNMAEQTWRVKACYDSAPAGLRPLRVCGKLAWPTAGAKKLLLGVTV
jgi:hypothetical protein